MSEENQDRLNGFDWLLIGLLMVSLVFFLFYWFESRDSAQAIDETLLHKWTNVFVVDVYADQQASQKSVLDGNDMVMLAPTHLDNEVDPNHIAQALSPYNFLNLGLLAPISSALVTPQDFVFNKLYLLSYDKEAMTLVPLYQAGIRALTFYRGRILLRLELNNIDTHQILGYVIMSDGSQRFIHMVPIEDHYFSGQATLANH